MRQQVKTKENDTWMQAHETAMGQNSSRTASSKTENEMKGGLIMVRFHYQFLVFTCLIFFLCSSRVNDKEQP